MLEGSSATTEFNTVARVEAASPQPKLAGEGFPDFTAEVPAGGYRWWYLDAFSDDGQAGLTLIASIGSVFSPYYAAARRRGAAPAEAFSSLNVVFYGPDRKRWAMTERSARGLRRDNTCLQIGPSSLTREGLQLVAHIDEVTVPLPRRLRGRIRISLPGVSGRCYALDDDGLHRWWPVAPQARVEVELDRPGLSWSGSGYLDCNAGRVPLESTFSGWHWCRAVHADGGSTVFYDTDARMGADKHLALRFDPKGQVASAAQPLLFSLPDTRIWRIERLSRSQPGPIKVLNTFEDTPFYARSKVGLTLEDEPVIAMHESLNLQRFKRRWVQGLLPFRMPRRA
ncbi:MAG: carotenoid 1,2-hydratase [Pseudomonadota bacterium]